MINSSDIISTYNTNTDKYFTISWKITEGCNYKCPYCIASCQGKKADPKENIEKIAKGINEICKEIDKPILLHFVGGEPSLYDLTNVLKIIDNDKIININVISNLSRPVKYWVDFIEYCKTRNIKPTLLFSYHPTECDKNIFLNKLKDLYEQSGYKFSVGLVFNNDNIELDVIDFIKNLKLKINMAKERDLNNKCAIISPENEKIFKDVEDYNSLLRNKSLKPAILTRLRDNTILEYSTSSSFISDLNEGGFIANGKYCTAGVTTIRILPNGEVLRAGCNFCQNNYQLGNLLNDDIITLPKEPILCQLSKDKFCPLCYKVNTYE